MNAHRIGRKIDKLIAELSGYVYKAEHEFAMPLEEEKIAIVAACGAMAIAVGRKLDTGARRKAEQLAQAVAAQIGEQARGSAHVAAPGSGSIIKL